MRISAARSGYSTHMQEMILAFEQTGNSVFPLIGMNRQPSKLNRAASRKGGLRRLFPGYLIEKLSVAYQMWFDRKYTAYAQNQSKAFSADFIYERYIPYHRSGIRLKQRLKVPLVLEVNAPLSELNVHYGRRKRIFAQRIENAVFSAADAIVVVSDVLKQSLSQSGIDASKIHVIHNAADCDRFYPEIDGRPVREKYGIADQIVIGFVGAFSRWHGVDALLEAARLVVRENKRIHFLLVGDGPMRESAEKFVRAHGLSNFATFTNRIPNQQIPGHIAAMDIAIMPSSNHYGSPIKIFEYMAMAKPVIAPNVKPVQEIITHGYTGMLVDPGDAVQIADAISELCDNSALRIMLAELGRQHVQAHHTWKKNAERVLEIVSAMKKGAS